MIPPFDKAEGANAEMRPSTGTASDCQPGRGSLLLPAAEHLDIATGGPSLSIDEVDLDCPAPLFEDQIPVVPISLETRGVTSHVQGELWRKQTVWKAQLADRLESVGRFDLSEPLRDCHTQQIHLACRGCSARKSFWNRCDVHYCPECQPSLARKRLKAVEWWAKTIRQPKHVILTIQNQRILDKPFVQAFKAAFSRLRRMAFARNWRGGYYSLEVTNKGNGWHLHIHAMVDAGWVDQAGLSDAWSKATMGLGKIVHVSDCRDKDKLRETTKYAVKGNDLAKWSGEESSVYIDAMAGVRTFGVFGSCFGQRAEYRAWLDSLDLAAITCQCGCNSWRRLSLEEFHGLIPGQAPATGGLGAAPPQMEFPLALPSAQAIAAANQHFRR